MVNYESGYWAVTVLDHAVDSARDTSYVRCIVTESLSVRCSHDKT